MSDKPSWSTVPPKASLSHELWKGLQVPRNTTAPPRPPPGLANAKPSSAWGGSGLGLPVGWSTTSYSAGSSWGSDSSSRTSSWLVLRNLTPQIDGSTLRTLCLQHGPLLTFHLSLSQGSAVVRYSSSEEAAKAQKSLHMCVLGNTTILAEFAGEEEVNRFFAQGRSLTPPASNQGRLGLAGAGPSHSTGQWSDGRVEASDSGSGGSGTDLLWGGAPSQYSSLWGSPRREDGGLIGSPAPISTLLPGDLLSGESL
uniref:TNRC6 PABC binding domain-containing protein n=2 Tax=Paramormyrops kingsleyae TaxID=1676925 RepID=A0A3B3QPQ9_9TELE